MINLKNLIKMARMWQQLRAITSRKQITYPSNSSTNSCSDAKGHFVVYTADGTRFVVPLDYLRNDILCELFRMAEEEYGLPSSSPIMLPCDSAFLSYAVTLIQRGANKDLQRAFLTSFASDHCSTHYSYTQLGQTNPQMFVTSF